MGESDAADPNHAVDCTYGCYAVFLSTLVFSSINLIIKVIGPPKSLRADEWKWRNLFVSWIHAITCAVWVITSAIIHPEMFLDLQYYKTYSIVFLNATVTGYFLYDFLDIVLKGRFLTDWELILHHVPTAVGFYYTIVICEWQVFIITVTGAEINTCFLHARKLLQMIGTPFSSRLYRLVVFLNIVTFPFFRGVPICTMLWATLFYYHRLSLGFYLFTAGSTAVMISVQTTLFYRLLRSDFWKKKKPAKSSVDGGQVSHCDGQGKQTDANSLSSPDLSHPKSS